MKAIFYFSLVVIFLFSFYCNKNDAIITGGDNASENGILKIDFQKAPSDVDHIIAKLSREGFEERTLILNLSDSNKSASGTFSNVPIGTWHLRVDAYDEMNVLKYTGETDIEVLPDETTIAELELISVSGTIVVHVTWGKTCVSLPSGAVSWWRGEGNTEDEIGGNKAFFEDEPIFKRGKVGKGFYFDGIDDRLRIPDAENLKITGSLTIEAWIFVESYPYGAGQILFRGDNRNGYDPYSLTLLSSGNLQFVIWSTEKYVDIKTSVGLGKFIHVAGTLDSATGVMRLYVDGVVKAETTTTIRPFRDLDQKYLPGVAIGNTQGTGFLHNHPFHGIIDEVAIYNRALSEAEIKAIYEAGSAGKCR